MIRRLHTALLTALAALCASLLTFPQAARSALPDTPLRASDKSQSAEFGTSVALRGDLALIGAPQIGVAGNGAAYVFRFDGSSWAEEQKLLAGDGGILDEFGGAVAMDGDSIAIGASGDNHTSLANPGSVYVFEFNGSAWLESAKLTAADAAANDEL